MDVEAVSDGLERHVREFFTGRQVVQRPEWVDRHALKRLPGLRLLEIEPSAEGELWVYVSIGAWQVTSQERHGLELAYLSSTPGRRLAKNVLMAVYYHANPDDESYRLWEGHTVAIGRPIAPESRLDHLLVCKPYPYGWDFEFAKVEDVSVHFFWLLPITEAEKGFRHEHDLEALESRFEEVGLEYWELDRESAV